LTPEEGSLPVRHVYGEDVVQAIMKLAGSDIGKGRAYNIGQDETVTLEQFLATLAELVRRPIQLARVPRAELERQGLLPDCSPFSGKWMSSLDNCRSKAELGITYTPMREYLKKLIGYYQAHPREIEGYAQRA